MNPEDTARQQIDAMLLAAGWIIQNHSEAITQGGRVEKGFVVDKRSRATRSRRQLLLDEDLAYAVPELDRSVVVTSQINTMFQAFKDALATELFSAAPSCQKPSYSPKTTRTPKTSSTSCAKPSGAVMPPQGRCTLRQPCQVDEQAWDQPQKA